MENIKENILTRTCELYLKYGIKSITMDDVSRELGISKKTLYQHFKDKRELVVNSMGYHFHGGNNKLNEIFKKGLNAIEELFEVNLHIIEMLKNFNPSLMFDLKKYYPDIFLKFEETRRERMYVSVIDNLKKGKKEGLYRSELKEEIIAKLHVSRVEHILDSNIFTVQEFTSPAFMNEMFIYHLRGIASEAGLATIKEVSKKYKI